jgi:hypothetical protein
MTTTPAKKQTSKASVKGAAKEVATPALLERVTGILQTARTQAARSVNTAQVVANWLVGREIVQEEQAGRRRAGYGATLLKALAVRLKADFGSGYGVDNLEMFRRFYIEYPNLLPTEISDAPRRKLKHEPARSQCDHAIAGRLSLRAPQHESLKQLASAIEASARHAEARPRRRRGGGGAEALKGLFPTLQDFEREFPLAVFCAGHWCGQDAADGRVHQLPVSGARHQTFLCAGAQPDDLRQADCRLHAQHAQIRVQGHCGVFFVPAGDHHRRQLRRTRPGPGRLAVAGDHQHLQHCQDHLRGARWQGAAHQAPERVHRPELL